MTFSQKSDVKKHLAHPLKKTHYLTPANLNTPVPSLPLDRIQPSRVRSYRRFASLFCTEASSLRQLLAKVLLFRRKKSKPLTLGSPRSFLRL